MLKKEKIATSIAVCLVFVFSAIVLGNSQASTIGQNEDTVNSKLVNTQQEQSLALQQSLLSESSVKINVKKNKIVKGEQIEVQADLSDSNNNPLADQQLTFTFNAEIIATQTTDANGHAEIIWDTSNANVGEYLLKAFYSGNKNFESSLAYVIVTIEENKNLITGNAVNLGDNVQKIEDCKNNIYNEEEKVYGTCTEERFGYFCDDEPLNQSCKNSTRQLQYKCVTGTNIIQKTRKECDIKGYIINDKIQLYTEKYSCSISLEDGNLIVLCDSRFDGNGDSICTSGESCTKFIINGNTVEQIEKNSRDNFVESDVSYFAPKASAEVLP